MTIVPFERPAAKPQPAPAPDSFAAMLVDVAAQGYGVIGMLVPDSHSVGELRETIDEAASVGWKLTRIGEGEADGVTGLMVTFEAESAQPHDPAEATRAWQGQQAEKSAASSQSHDDAARVSGFGVSRFPAPVPVDYDMKDGPA